MAGSRSGSGSSSDFTLSARSRFWNAIRPVLASSISSVLIECWVDFPCRTTVASGGRHVGRRPGHQDRRRVEHLGVVPLATPGEEREPDGEQEAIGAPMIADHGVELAQEVQPRGRLRRDRRVDQVDGLDQPSADLSLAGGRQDHLVEERLEVALREVAAQEAGAGVVVGLPVQQARLEADQEHEPVVEAGATDAPLVDQRLGGAPGSNPAVADASTWT